MVYIPHSDADIEKMLKACGLKSIDELFDTIPDELKQREPSNLQEPLTEDEVIDLATGLASENLPLSDIPSFIGAGLYDHFIPSVVKNITSRNEFLTSYTPYQAEASQGTLQAIYEYQSMISELTGMDVSNASSYDGGTACADALVLIHALLGRKRRKVLVSDGLHPEYREVMATYNFGLEMEIEAVPLKDGLTDYDALEKKISEDIAGCFIQYPNCLGVIEDLPRIEKLNRKLHSVGAVSVAVNNPIALGILKPPGHIGFDIAVGEGQPLGIPVGFGGPLLGFFTAKRELIWKLPGRLIGRTIDESGNEGFVLNLQAREQHIRRERATSNICTNQAMTALAACVYMAYWGKKGFPLLAKEIAGRARILADRLAEVKGLQLLFPGKAFFNEIAVKIDGDPNDINMHLIDSGFVGGFPLGKWFDEYGDCMLLSVTERNSPDDMEDFCEDLEMILSGEMEGGDAE